MTGRFAYDVHQDDLRYSGLSLNGARKIISHPAVVTVRCLACGWESTGHTRIALAQDAKRCHSRQCTGVKS